MAIPAKSFLLTILVIGSANCFADDASNSFRMYGMTQQNVLEGSDYLLPNDHACSSLHNQNDHANHFCHAIAAREIDRVTGITGAGTVFLMAKETTDKNFSWGDVAFPIIRYQNTEVVIFGDGVYVGTNIDF